MAIYAIGDVQGCYEELQMLLEKIQFNEHADQLWFVGDLVNRGKNSLAVLQFIKSLNKSATSVLGNHDLHLLAVAYGHSPLRKQDTFEDILNAPDRDELLNWLRHLPFLHYDPTLNAVMTHAGLFPKWTLSQTIQYAKEVETCLQSDAYHDFFIHLYGNEPNQWGERLMGWDRVRFIVNALTRMRFCGLNSALDFIEVGPVGSQPPHLVPWFELPANRMESLTVLFGHWAALNGVTHLDNVVALDTGCAWGDRLSAYRLHDRQWFDVKSIRQ